MNIEGTSEQPAELVFSTSDVPAPERLAYWRESVCEPIHGMAFEWTTDAPQQAAMTLRSFSGQSSVECVSPPARIVRDRARRSVAPDCYHLMCHLSGEGSYRQAGCEVVVSPGDLVLHDAALPLEINLRRHRVRGWTLPRARLEPLLSDPTLAVNVRIGGGFAIGALLTAHLDALWRTFGQVAGGPATALVDHLCQLVALALDADASRQDGARESLRAAGLQAALAAIDRGFRDPGLSAEQVALQLGLSRRSLYRLFEESGRTFSRCVQQRRLAESRRLLAEGKASITQIAFACGFNDLSTFHRAFRARYGLSPRDLRCVIASSGADA